MARSVFVTYNGLLDPLGQSQVLPYLEGLSTSYEMAIVSFERAARLKQATRGALADRLGVDGILWRALRYHRRPSLLATAWDVRAGRRTVRSLAARGSILHARGYVPAQIVSGLHNTHRFLFDIRGLMPDEYVDGGLWRKGGLKYRLTKRAEAGFFASAHAAVVLTEAIRPHVEQRFAETGREVPVTVIPCCVDLDLFRFDSSERERLRSEWAVAADEVVFVYAGSVGTWYLADEMARFVASFRDVAGRAVTLVWLVNNDAEVVERASRNAGLAESEVVVDSVSREEMPGYLSAADVGLAIVKPCFSKKASSPTKYAEYLACGLPIVLSSEVGDSAALIEAGVAVHRTGVEELLKVMEQPRERFREYARVHFDLATVGIPRYEQIYAALADIKLP